MRSTFCWSFAAVVWSCVLARAAPRYEVTDLGTIRVIDINSYGQVVGWSGSGGHALLWTPNAANSTSGSLTDLGVLAGYTSSAAYGINDFGQVAGESGNGPAFIWTPTSPHATTGTMSALPFRGGYGVNASGQVTGYRTGSGSRAILWTPNAPNTSTGTDVDLGSFQSGGSSTPNYTAVESNARGQVVGQGGTANGLRVMLWTPNTPNGSVGTMLNLGSLDGGAFPAFAEDINSAGQIVGTSQVVSGANHPFLWTPDVPNGSTGSFRDLGLLPGIGDIGEATSINDLGQVVGYRANFPGERGFVWSEAEGKIDLNTLVDASGWVLKGAWGINNSGQIAGNGTFDPDGTGPLPAIARGYLLTPIPEPAAIAAPALFAAGILALRRRSVTIGHG